MSSTDSAPAVEPPIEDSTNLGSEEPEVQPAPNRAARRHPEAPTSIYGASRRFSVSEKTLERWIGLGFITGWQDGRAVVVDVMEIERALLVNPRMRDGRRSRFGPNSVILPMPKSSEVGR